MSPLRIFLLVALGLVARELPAEEKWSRLTGCRWLDNPSNDGDSLHVQYKGKEYIFRLYFVDACETNRQIPERVDQQAAFLNITPRQVLEAGAAAREMTERFLRGTTFTVLTKWEDALGASALPRNYAFILFGANDEHDLATTLIANGLGRVYGMPANPPGGVTAAEFLQELKKLEMQARRQKVGLYGDLSGRAAATGSRLSGSSPTGNAQGFSPITILLPAKSHPPDVVDDPMDAEFSRFAVDSLQSMTITPAAPVEEGDFSEIPGWKPKPAPSATPPAPAPADATSAADSVRINAPEMFARMRLFASVN